MMTFNGRHRWVFSLAPTDSAYDKLGEYCGKLQKAEIEALEMQVDFGEIRWLGKWRNPKI